MATRKGPPPKVDPSPKNPRTTKPPPKTDDESSYQSYESCSRSDSSTSNACPPSKGTTIKLAPELKFRGEHDLEWTVHKRAGEGKQHWHKRVLEGDTVVPGYSIDIKRNDARIVSWSGAIKVVNCGGVDTKGLVLFYSISIDDCVVDKGTLSNGDHCVKIGKKLKFALEGSHEVKGDHRSVSVRATFIAFIENYGDCQNTVCGPKVTQCERVKFGEAGCCKSVVFTDVLTGIVPSTPAVLLLGPQTVHHSEKVFVQSASVDDTRAVNNIYKEKNIASIICSTESKPEESEATTEVTFCTPGLNCSQVYLIQTQCLYDYTVTLTPLYETTTPLVLEPDPADATRFIVTIPASSTSPASSTLPYQVTVTRTLSQNILSQVLQGFIGITGCEVERTGTLSLTLSSSCGTVTLPTTTVPITTQLVQVNTGDISGQLVSGCTYSLQTGLRYETYKFAVQPDTSVQSTQEGTNSVSCTNPLTPLLQLLPSSIVFDAFTASLFWVRTGSATVPSATGTVTITPDLSTVPIDFTNDSFSTTVDLTVSIAASEVANFVSIVSPYSLLISTAVQYTATCGTSTSPNTVVNNATVSIVNPQSPNPTCCLTTTTSGKC